MLRIGEGTKQLVYMPYLRKGMVIKDESVDGQQVPSIQ